MEVCLQLCSGWDDSAKTGAKLRTAVVVRSNVKKCQFYEDLRSSYGSLELSWRSLTNSIIA